MDFFIGLAIYFSLTVAICIVAVLPGIIAFRRRAHNRWFILTMNILLGGTGIGWIVALIWACRARQLAETGRRYNMNGTGLDLMMDDVRRLAIFPHDQPLVSTAVVAATYSVEQVTDGIERLSTLEREGYLTAGEFTALKIRIIARAR